MNNFIINLFKIIVSGDDNNLIGSLVDKGVIDTIISVFDEKEDKEVQVCFKVK